MAAKAELAASTRSSSGGRSSRPIVIKVFVCASSVAELEGLEAIVRSAPSLEFVDGNSSGADLREDIDAAEPDVVLQRIPAGGLDESNMAIEDLTDLPSVLLVEPSDFASALAGMQAEGSMIRGVLPAWANDQEIQIALQAAVTGLLVLHEDVAEQLAAAPRPAVGSSLDAHGEGLSPREREVLNLLAAGLGNKEIASQLKISEHTVKFHVTSVFNRLNVYSRAEAVAVGIRRGFIAV